MNNASSPLVSVVTPVYNNVEHLAECIESVLSQTYTNWDYTIVNNCSKDGSLEVARRYASRHPRIRVQENEKFLPVMANHNMAVRQISPSSKYCKVVFADDWIFPECLEKMVAVAEKHPSVGIVGAYALEGREVRWTGLPYPSTVVSGREVCREHLLRDLFVFGSANAMLYRADLVRSHDPFFNEANIHSDTEICFDLLKSCDFGFVHQVLSFTRLRPESLNAVSISLESHFAGMLQSLLTHGRHYLTEEEFQTRHDRYLSEYYSFLGKSVLLGRGRRVLGYHRKQLARLPVGYSRFRLARALVANLFSAALNPMDTIAKALKMGTKRG